MVLVRMLVLLVLACAIVCFAIFAVTGLPQWRKRGLTLVTWTVGAGLLFFGLLIAERLLHG